MKKMEVENPQLSLYSIESKTILSVLARLFFFMFLNRLLYLLLFLYKLLDIFIFPFLFFFRFKLT